MIRAGWMWGDEPFSWLQVDAIFDGVIAAATLATLIWAVVTTIRAERRAAAAEYRERQHARAREEAAARAQASRVTIYKAQNQSTVPTSFGRSMTFPVLKVNNASDQPIFAVTAYGTVPEGDGMTTLRSETSPSAPPGDILDLTLNSPPDGILSDRGLIYADEVAWVAVVFRDANEVEWLRTETGRLVQMPDDPEAAQQLLADCLAEQWTAGARARYEQKTNEVIAEQSSE